MSTQFFARFFGGGSEWPMWRKVLWFALLCEAFAFLCAGLLTIYKGTSLVPLILSWIISMVAAIVLIYSSDAYYKKWLMRKDEGHTARWERATLVFMCVFFMVAQLLFVVGWGMEKAGYIQAQVYHPETFQKPLNPLICVNDTPTQGFAAPLTEKLAVTGEIRSIELCPPPFTFSLHVEGMRFRGETVYSYNPRFDFNPPLRLKPGEEIEVTVLGKELNVYKQTNSPTYVIYRQQPYSLDEIRGFLTEGGRDPGYTSLDWDRMEKSGLIYLDHSMVGEKRQVDAIYVTYGDVIDLPSWWQTDYYPSSHEIVRIPFTFCVKRESDMFLAGYMHDLPVGDRRMIVTIEKDGTVLVREPDKQSILFVCNNDLR